MNAPVDALAVLDAATYNLWSEAGEQYAAPLRLVRGRVAEVFAAAAALEEAARMVGAREMPIESIVPDRMRVRDALAACGVQP